MKRSDRKFRIKDVGVGYAPQVKIGVFWFPISGGRVCLLPMFIPAYREGALRQIELYKNSEADPHVEYLNPKSK